VEQAECADHRETIMERLGPGWVWCLLCERAYQREEVRWNPEDGIYMCAYEGCDGDALLHAWSYEERRVACGWPEVPEKGIVYPLYK
jgi:hypothetical protein